ncbi:hypothetical protein A5722_14840 [Mycobacterium vulneris]|nr:hypothetical protein A5722_14840 [Mycolicibacterium vulneris]OCB66205.1 hypothetical protein A5729_12345 [Mycolicibacterium vulneris]
MGVDTTKASDHPSTNELDKHGDNSVDTGGAYIGFRATNMKLENPPEIGDSLTLVVRVKCIGDGHQLMADGELRPKRSLKVEWVGPAGSKPPTDQVQTGMFDKDGQVTPQAAGEDDGDEEDDDELDTSGPAFSDDKGGEA